MISSIDRTTSQDKPQTRTTNQQQQHQSLITAKTEYLIFKTLRNNGEIAREKPKVNKLPYKSLAGRLDLSVIKVDNKSTIRTIRRRRERGKYKNPSNF